MVPVMALNLAFASSLPPEFQPDIFWQNFPPVVTLPEQVSRIGMFMLTLLLPINFVGRQHRFGWGLYGVGLIGSRFFVTSRSNVPSVFVSCSTAFLLVHNLHAWLVYGRNF